MEKRTEIRVVKIRQPEERRDTEVWDVCEDVMGKETRWYNGERRTDGDGQKKRSMRQT